MEEIFMNPVKIWQVVTKYYISHRNVFYQKHHSKTRIGLSVFEISSTIYRSLPG